MNPKVDFFFNKAQKWQEAFKELRTIALDCDLTEDLKWGCPCYTLENRNIVLIHGFKDYCALLLFKGALMKDPKGILVQQTENVQAARQIRFTSLQQIVKLRSTLKAYIREAIKVEDSGEKGAHEKDKGICHAGRIPNQAEQDTRVEESVCRFNTWPATGISALLLFGQAGQDPRGEGRKVYPSNS